MLFEQEGLSAEIQLISAFLQSLTDDSTPAAAVEVNKQAGPGIEWVDASSSNSNVIGHSPVPDNLLTYPSTLHYPPPHPLYLQRIHNNETGDFHAAVRTDLILAGWMIAIGFASSDN